MKKIISTYLIFVFILMTFSGCERIKNSLGLSPANVEIPANPKIPDNSNKSESPPPPEVKPKPPPNTQLTQDTHPQQLEENSNNNADEKEEEPQKTDEEVPATPEVVATTSRWGTGLKFGAYTVGAAILATTAYFGKKYYDYRLLNHLNVKYNSNDSKNTFINWMTGKFEFTNEKNLRDPSSIPKPTLIPKKTSSPAAHGSKKSRKK